MRACCERRDRASRCLISQERVRGARPLESSQVSLCPTHQTSCPVLSSDGLSAFLYGRFFLRTQGPRHVVPLQQRSVVDDAAVGLERKGKTLQACEVSQGCLRKRGRCEGQSGGRNRGCDALSCRSVEQNGKRQEKLNTAGACVEFGLCALETSGDQHAH